MRMIKWIGAVGLVLATQACVVRESRPVNGGYYSSSTSVTVGQPSPYYVSSQPPEPLYETMSVSPGYGHVWIDGYWHWNGYEWVWVGGRWEREQAENYVYIQPYYDYSNNQHVYTPGYWSTRDRAPRGWTYREHRDGRPRGYVPPRGGGGWSGGDNTPRPRTPPIGGGGGWHDPGTGGGGGGYQPPSRPPSRPTNTPGGPWHDPTNDPRPPTGGGGGGGTYQPPAEQFAHRFSPDHHTGRTVARPDQRSAPEHANPPWRRHVSARPASRRRWRHVSARAASRQWWRHVSTAAARQPADAPDDHDRPEVGEPGQRSQHRRHLSAARWQWWDRHVSAAAAWHWRHVSTPAAAGAGAIATDPGTKAARVRDRLVSVRKA
ncbi:MAG: hypothetical protein WKG01_24500, partial [Kofleriaceae bacterium]